MTRPPCPLDEHVDRPVIDAMIVAGLLSPRHIAKVNGVQVGDVRRHARRCLARSRAREGSMGAGGRWVQYQEDHQ